jgi:hypothetical protein
MAAASSAATSSGAVGSAGAAEGKRGIQPLRMIGGHVAWCRVRASVFLHPNWRRHLQPGTYEIVEKLDIAIAGAAMSLGNLLFCLDFLSWPGV